MAEEDRTVYCGNLPERITEELLFELFLQAGPVEKVKIPNDTQGRPASYGFVTLKHVDSLNYSIKLLDGILLFDRKLTLKPRNGNRANKDNSSPVKHSNNMPFDANGLLALANNIKLSNAVHNMVENYNHGGGNQYSGPRRNHYREERRMEQVPYRQSQSRSNRDRYNNRRNPNESNMYNRNTWRY